MRNSLYKPLYKPEPMFNWVTQDSVITNHYCIKSQYVHGMSLLGVLQGDHSISVKKQVGVTAHELVLGTVIFRLSMWDHAQQQKVSHMC